MHFAGSGLALQIALVVLPLYTDKLCAVCIKFLSKPEMMIRQSLRTGSSPGPSNGQVLRAATHHPHSPPPFFPPPPTPPHHGWLGVMKNCINCQTPSNPKRQGGCAAAGVTVVQPLSSARDKHTTYSSAFPAKPTQGFIRVPSSPGPAPAPFTATTTYG